MLESFSNMNSIFEARVISQVNAGSHQSRVEQVKNPSKSPFTKGDFLFPPLKKGGRGDFWTIARCEFNSVK
jgi:hypothetical protein